MGLHFHDNKVRHYKQQGKDELIREQTGVDPLDKLNADLERQILKEDAKQHATDAQKHLSHAAEHFKQALIDYKDALKNKVTGKPVVAPKPKP